MFSGALPSKMIFSSDLQPANTFEHICRTDLGIVISVNPELYENAEERIVSNPSGSIIPSRFGQPDIAM